MPTHGPSRPRLGPCLAQRMNALPDLSQRGETGLLTVLRAASEEGNQRTEGAAGVREGCGTGIGTAASGIPGEKNSVGKGQEEGWCPAWRHDVSGHVWGGRTKPHSFLRRIPGMCMGRAGSGRDGMRSRVCGTGAFLRRGRNRLGPPRPNRKRLHRWGN